MDDFLLDVDRHGVLRVRGLLWVSLAILAREWVLVILALASARSGSSLAMFIENGIPWFGLAAAIPALLVAWAAGNRTPQAGKLPRAVWHQGKTLLLATTALNIALAAYRLTTAETWRLWPELMLGSWALLDLAIGYDLLTSRYYPHLFREFPLAKSESPSA